MTVTAPNTAPSTTPNLAQLIGGITSAYTDNDPRRLVRRPQIRAAGPVVPQTFARPYTPAPEAPVAAAPAMAPAAPAATAGGGFSDVVFGARAADGGAMTEGVNRDRATAADAAAKQARTGGGGFDPGAPTPDVLSTISPSLGAIAAPGADASRLYQQPRTTAQSPVAVPPGPTGKVAGALTAALPGGLGIPNANGAPARTSNLPTDVQSAWLANRGVPVDQQTDTAIGGDGSGDDAAAQRRAVIRGGTAPGQNVRLGYDKTSRIYGTSSRPGGPIDTFTGIGVADPNNPSMRIDGASEVAAQRVGLGITPAQSTAAAQYRDETGRASQLPGAVAAPYDPSTDIQDAVRDRNSDLASILTRDPRSALGIAARNLTLDLSSHRNRTSRYGTSGQSPAEIATSGLIGAIGQNFEARTNAATSRARNDATLAGIGARADATRYAADARTDASEYGADIRAGAARDVATTKANTPKVNAAETRMFNDSYKKAYSDAISSGLSEVDAAAHASDFGRRSVLAYRAVNAGGVAQQQKPTLDAFKAAAKKQGSKLSDADLETAFEERYGTSQ